MQPIWIEVHVDFGIESACQIALDHHAPEAFLASDLHLWAKLLLPIKLDRVVGNALALRPGDGYPAGRHRKGTKLRGIDGQFVQRETKILRRFGLERDRRPIDRNLDCGSIEIAGQVAIGSAHRARRRTNFRAPVRS